MHLTSIQGTNFKNYPEIKVGFSSSVNLISGSNGSGKTNLLDAIYFLCLTKSAFHSTDSLNIKHEEDFFALKGIFHKHDEAFQIQAAVQRNQKKIFKINKKPYDRISDHIGAFPTVLATPNDTDLVREGSGERRKFFDGILSLTNRAYLESLLLYTKVLKQRNALLKQFAEKGRRDHELLASYDHALSQEGVKLFNFRRDMLEEFLPFFSKHTEHLTQQKEVLELLYQSDQHEKSLDKSLRESLPKDLATQRTNVGIHRDDYTFTLGTLSMKSFGSQGQQKSFVIALKLAQYDFIFNKTGIKPILLLDDIFDKLDQQRIEKLLEIIASETAGQVFITEARADRVENFFGVFPGEIRKFRVDKGEIHTS